MLKDRTFSAGVFLMTMLGFVLYASLMLLPIFLQTLLGYPALQSGLALSPRGIGSLVMMPIAGQLTNRYDPRKLIVVGLIVGGWTMFSLSHLNLNAGYWDIFWPQMIQGAAMAFLFIPLMATSMSGIAKEKMGNATSIYNLMRNIGGSFGIATMTTFLARRSQVHQNQLVSHISAFDHTTQLTMRGMTELVPDARLELRGRIPKSLGRDVRHGAAAGNDAVVRRGVLGHGRHLPLHAAAAAPAAQRARPASAHAEGEAAKATGRGCITAARARTRTGWGNALGMTLNRFVREHLAYDAS